MGGLTEDGRVHQLTGWGMSRESNHLHQPPAVFYAPALVGHHCGNQRGPWPPTLVQAVQNFDTSGDDGGKIPQHHNLKEGTNKNRRFLAALQPGYQEGRSYGIGTRSLRRWTHLST